MNDGKTPASSSDKSGGAYGNWNGEGDYHTWQWVLYDWHLDPHSMQRWKTKKF